MPKSLSPNMPNPDPMSSALPQGPEKSANAETWQNAAKPTPAKDPYLDE